MSSFTDTTGSLTSVSDLSGNETSVGDTSGSITSQSDVVGNSILYDDSRYTYDDIILYDGQEGNVTDLVGSSTNFTDY